MSTSIKGKEARELYLQNVKWIKQGNWMNDEIVSRISVKSKDKVEMLFEMNYPKVMSQGYIIRKAKLESVTVYKIIRAMIMYGAVEQIPTVTVPLYKLRKK